MAKRRKQTPAEKAYNRERRRIQRQITRVSQRGYDVPENILPPQPKRITEASVRRLQKITTPRIYERSRYIDVETGEILTGTEGRRLERQAAARRAAETRRAAREVRREYIDPEPPQAQLPIVEYVQFDEQILTVFQMEMTEIYGRNEKLFNYISRWFQMARQRYGDEDFADALERAKANGEWPGWEGVSDSEILVGKLTGILEMVGGTSGGRQEILEALEEGEDWTMYEDEEL
jgi:hypothetical protein